MILLFMFTFHSISESFVSISFRMTDYDLPLVDVDQTEVSLLRMCPAEICLE